MGDEIKPERVTGILNKGRCSRCLASRKVIDEFKDGTFHQRLWCLKFNKRCQAVAGFRCRESPMGIDTEEMNWILSGQSNIAKSNGT